MGLFNTRKERDLPPLAPFDPSFPYHIEGRCTSCQTKNVIYDIRNNNYVMQLLDDLKSARIKCQLRTAQLLRLRSAVKTAHTDTWWLGEKLDEIASRCDKLVNSIFDEAALSHVARARLMERAIEISTLAKAEKGAIPERFAQLKSVWDEEIGEGDDVPLWRTVQESSEKQKV